MANKKISALTAITSLDTGDVFPVVDVSVPETKKITRENLALDLQTLMPVLPIVNAGGTVDAITADYTPNITLSDRRLCAFIATGANTSTTPTFAPDGLTAHTIVKMGGQALAAGDIPGAEAVCILQYDLTHTRWELLNPTVFVSDAAYGAGWNGVTTISPSKNAVYDSLMAKTGENLAIGADADGDIYYRAASVLARLAKGPINHTLRMNAAGTAPNWEAEAKGHPFNLQLSVNASVNKLDVFSKSSGAVPDASNVIAVNIPDVSGNVVRTRAAAYLSGTSQFVLADATCYWVGIVSLGNSTTQIDISNPGGTTFRYTYDTTGRNPGFGYAWPPIGDFLRFNAQNFNAVNNGTFAITGNASNYATWYVDVVNAAGSAETDKTIGTGSIKYFKAKSHATNIHWAYVYAIWDGTGIVWGLAGHPFHRNVPVTTELESTEYMLIEESSTYTKNNAHYCKCVGRVPYTYYTANAPDHTFLGVIPSTPIVSYVDDGKAGIIQTRIFTLGGPDFTNVICPFDDTVPQYTEGKVVMAFPFTPRRIGTRVVLSISGLTHSVSENPAHAFIIQDWGTAAIAGTPCGVYVGSHGQSPRFFEYTFKTISLTTIEFILYMGAPSGGYACWNCNDTSYTNYYGTAANPLTIIVTEYDDSL